MPSDGGGRWVEGTRVLQVTGTQGLSPKRSLSHLQPFGANPALGAAVTVSRVLTPRNITPPLAVCFNSTGRELSLRFSKNFKFTLSSWRGSKSNRLQPRRRAFPTARMRTCLVPVPPSLLCVPLVTFYHFLHTGLALLLIAF